MVSDSSLVAPSSSAAPSSEAPAINLPLSTLFTNLEAEMKKSQDLKTQFLANSTVVLQSRGIPISQTWVDASVPLSMYPTAPEGIASGITVSKHWWGVDFIMTEQLTQDIVVGTQTVGDLAKLIKVLSVIDPIAETLATGLSLAFKAKETEIKWVDNGNGVHWPITWPQWATLVAGLPIGPSGILSAALIFIHPLRNK